MPCSPEVLRAVLNWIELIRLATACVSHSGNWFQVFCVCSECKFFSSRAFIIWNKTENNLNNMKTVLFLLYSGSSGRINSYYCRPIKLEENTWSGVSVILPCCNLPGLWCHESRSGVEAQTQLWTAVKAKISFAISCNFRPLLPWERNGGKGRWLNWVLKKKSLKVYSGTGSCNCLNTSDYTSNHSNSWWNICCNQPSFTGLWHKQRQHQEQSLSCTLCQDCISSWPCENSEVQAEGLNFLSS